MAVFIGGDTQELEFDFSTKVAGSILECPMRIYNSISPGLLNPNDVTSNWKTGWDKAVEKNQTEINKIKKSDGTVLCTTLKGTEKYITKYMIELDLNPLCNSKFGGSHEALKSALRKIDVNAWASGSGANGGKVGHKCCISIFNYDKFNEWFDLNLFTNNTSNISKTRYKAPNEGATQIKLSPDNKIYILIQSGYPSSATIPSTLNLDYINVKLTLARTPDKLMFTDSEGNKKDYLDVELGNEWSLLLKGVSPAYSSDEISNFQNLQCGIFDIDDNTWNNRIYMQFNKNNPNNIYFASVINEQYKGSFNQAITFNKFTTINILVQVKNNKFIIYILTNNGALLKKEIFFNNSLTGNAKIYLGSLIYGHCKSDCFIECFNFFDYAIAQNDQEAEVILKGRNEIDINNSRLNELGRQFENPNLSKSFNDGWRISGNATLSENNKELTLKATKAYQNSDIHVPVFPNNKYKLNGIKSEGNSFIVAIEYYNNISLGINHYHTDDAFVISNACNDLCLQVGSRESGIFTFSNLELRRLD